MTRSIEPQNLGDDDWYYEEKSALLLVHRVKDKDGVYIKTDQIKIPWRKIEASLRRRGNSVR